MTNPQLNRHALGVLDQHQLYWDSIGSPAHTRVMDAFLNTYGGTQAMLAQGNSPEDLVRGFAAAERDTWGQGATVVLDPEVHYLVTEMVESIPELPLTPQTLPAPAGVVSRPDFAPLFSYMNEHDKADGDTWGIEAFSVIAVAWRTDNHILAPGAEHGSGGVDLWLYFDYSIVAPLVEQDGDHSTTPADIAHRAALQRSRFLLSDRIPWAFGVPWKAASEKVIRESRTDRWYVDDDGALLVDSHVAGVRRWLMSLWEFMSSELLVTSNAHLPRPNLRRLAASGRMAEIPEDGALRVVQLRRARYIGPPNEETEEPNEGSADAPLWSHRWYVRPHWRKLPSGRVVPVSGYIKGPEDRPLVIKSDVLAVRR